MTTVGFTSAVSGRALGIPAGNIRKWVFRGEVHRFPDGTLDPQCVALRAIRRDIGREEYERLHQLRCMACRQGAAA